MEILNRDFFEAYYRSYNSEDPDALKEFYADDLVLVSAQGEQHGIDAMLATYRYLIENFKDRMTPESIIIDGDTAAIEITDVFTAKKTIADFMGAALKTGEQLTLRLCAVYRVSNNKITHATIYAR
ncbi:MAG: ketosteroid isomerase-like protein [Bermanella sp.]|jgi:ketosteroid isomerase-like protein